MRALVVGTALAAASGVISAATVGAEPEAEGRVVNGTPVDQATFEDNWSWAVALRIENTTGDTFLCGGSMITDSVVLSAAHCFADPALGTILPSGITVLGGNVNRTTPDFASAVSEYVTHPGFVPDTFANDVALLRLPAAVPVTPVLMASVGDVAQSGIAEVAGWGINQTDPNTGESVPPPPDIMHQATRVPIQSADYCNEGFGDGFLDPNTQVCAGDYNEQGLDPNTCSGDSGGPIVERGAIETTLIGITSFGFVLCGIGPGGYAGVGGYRSYIDPIANGWDPGGLATTVSLGSYIPVAPARIHDTRDTTPIAAGTFRAFPVAGLGGVPAGATTVNINLTAADPAADGYLTAYPCGGPPPFASNNNYVEGTSVGNAVAVGLDGSGQVCVLSYADSDVVIDVNGYWQPASAPGPGTLFNAIPPTRLFDSRARADATAQLKAGQILALDVSDLAAVEAVTAVSLNVTAVAPAEAGYITAFPCDGPVPPTSNVNVYSGDVVANGVIVKTSADERACFVASMDTDLAIDATGWFGVSGSTKGGRVTPLRNARLIDTRLGTSVAAGEVLAIDVAGVSGVPADALGVVLNITAVDPAAAGYLTAFPCGTDVPATSTVNYDAGEIVPNLALVGIGDLGKVCVFSFADSQVVVDVSGIVSI